ncbi:E3 ubiquitin-protein ligase hel2 [Labeo rohita]|uniref:E3 ubiquitin-protein ligase hel2 n=1 Tax=Labeo rohita TaxID=84645 RepID=A0ABQ8LTQ1_LABRO|nr:E3 ubiquitin-protein ligase hel2 [Labeo rohita]
MRENGYERMPPIEEMLASYLSLGEASSYKAPSLPSESFQQTSSLNGRAYAVAAQAVASLHMMAVLQAYQADLLKDLDKGQGLSPDEVAELRRTMDLALQATKQAATAMGKSMAAMVVTERHLWVNVADLGRKEKGFLLNALVSPSELFGTSVKVVIEKFREANARSAAFKTFIPRRTRSEAKHQKGPGPSRSEDRRRAQKASAPPPPAGRGENSLTDGPDLVFTKVPCMSVDEPCLRGMGRTPPLLTGPLVAVDISILDRIGKICLIFCSRTTEYYEVLPCSLDPCYITATPGLVDLHSGKLSEVHLTRCPWTSLAGYIALFSCLALRGFLLLRYSPNPHAFKAFIQKPLFSAGSEEHQPARHD